MEVGNREGSAPCAHEQTSEVGREGSKGQTGTEQCTCGAALCKLHMRMRSPALTPSPCAGDGMDAAAASTPLKLVINLLLHSIYLSPDSSPSANSFSLIPHLHPRWFRPHDLEFPCRPSFWRVPWCRRAIHLHVTAAYSQYGIHCLPALAVGQRLPSLLSL